jgi:hypothetical protein
MGELFAQDATFLIAINIMILNSEQFSETSVRRKIRFYSVLEQD